MHLSGLTGTTRVSPIGQPLSPGARAGPLYLRGPLRFCNLNSIDLATRRCATEPLIQRAGQSTVDAFWAIWQRLGLPDHQEVDNEWLFYGSPTHPRGMGMLIRLCLLYDVELWFIPPREPWRNGIVEGFNDHYQKKFLARNVIQPDEAALRDQRARASEGPRVLKQRAQIPS